MDNPDGDSGDKIYNQNCLKHLVDQQKNVSLDRTVEEFVMEMTNEFINSLLTNSAELSQHRKAEFMEAQDLNFVLENIWKMHGYKSDEGKAGQKRNLTDVHPMHEARMNNIKKLQQPPDKKKGPKKT